MFTIYLICLSDDEVSVRLHPIPLNSCLGICCIICNFEHMMFKKRGNKPSIHRNICKHRINHAVCNLEWCECMTLAGDCLIAGMYLNSITVIILLLVASAKKSESHCHCSDNIYNYWCSVSHIYHSYSLLKILASIICLTLFIMDFCSYFKYFFIIIL